MTAPCIGTSGWSYPTGGGTWNGLFYPRRGRGRSTFDELAYYADHFDTVEVNSSFYRPPAQHVTRSWVRRTPADFVFSLKLYQKFTHPGMYVDSTGEAATVVPDDVDGFRRAIDPIADAGKLGALLAQFPPSFKNDAAARAYLDWLLEAFAAYPVAVELRHRTWSDAGAQTLALLQRHESAWVQIDEPKFRFSVRQDRRPNAPGFYYMRLHGRNADAWWDHDRAEQRYDYLYSADELRPITESLRAARHGVGKVYVYLNNHFAAKAVVNAVQLQRAFDVPVRSTYPEAFVTRYPQIGALVATATPSLPLA
jgi:uncharacterized protein YecE (DUF72 family)